MFMLVEDQFGVGDVIDVGEATGVVETVGLRITRLRDVQGTLWHVPNGEIRRVGNLSQLWARTILDVSIARNTDLTHAMEVIRSAAHDLYTTGEGATILEEPEVWGVEEIGPDSISIRLAVKTEPSQQFKVARMLRARLKEAFDENGIEIPFPQRTIWVHNEADREE
jgi:small conductance mechanosensitive channel